jgi:hypothetical protein
MNDNDLIHAINKCLFDIEKGQNDQMNLILSVIASEHGTTVEALREKYNIRDKSLSRHIDGKRLTNALIAIGK